ncbi:MAG: sensor histidine kinase, partial [Gammaproteobacteria bacterium]
SILSVHVAVLSKLIPPELDAFESLKDIEDAVERLQNLLIQLLALARADGDTAAGDNNSADVQDVAANIVDQYLAQAMEKNVSLRLERLCDHATMRINAPLLTEILKNLIDNAIRYNKDGGFVVVRLKHKDGRSIVEVEDDGPGIPNSELSNVFLRFYRLKRDSGRPGSGLGLAIVQAIAATLNAEIQAGPGYDGQGLRVRVVLPQGS